MQLAVQVLSDGVAELDHEEECAGSGGMCTKVDLRTAVACASARFPVDLPDAHRARMRVGVCTVVGPMERF